MLGVECRDQSLPATARCPACGAMQLLIVQDPVADGQWHYCRSCRISGSLVQLASYVWNLPFSGTLLKLDRLGFQIPSFADSRLDVIKAYEQAMVARRRCESLWEEASDGRLLLREEYKALLGSLGISAYSRASLGGSHGYPEISRILGGHTAQAVADMVFPDRADIAVGRNKKDGGLKFRSPLAGVYPGGGWTDVMLVPFYDLPGRISMFKTWGRHGRAGKIGEVIVRINKAADPGLAFHSGLLSRKRQTIYAICDHARYLKLQFDSLRINHGLLPLVLWHDKDGQVSRFAWKMLQHHNVILWTETITPRLIMQAVHCNGSICLMRSSMDRQRQMTRLFEYQSPNDTLAQMRRRARPWPAALNRMYDLGGQSTLEEIFLYLDSEGVNVDRLLPLCSSRLAKLARDILGYKSRVATTVYSAGRTLVEENGVWYLNPSNPRRSGHVISDCTYRINKIVRFENSPAIQYKGVASFKGRSVEFVANMDEFERNPLDWLGAELIRRNVGVITYERVWQRRTLSAAKRLHAPKLVTGVDRVGWNAGTARISFPKFEIRFGGGFHCTGGDYLSGLPCSILSAAEGSGGYAAELSQLSVDNLVNRYVWAFLSHIAANLIAPICNRPKRGLVYSGQLAGRVAACVASALDLHVLRGKHPVSTCLKAERKHDVPIVDGRLVGSEAMSRYFDASWGDRNAIIQVKYELALLAGLSEHWRAMPAGFATSGEEEIDNAVYGPLISMALPTLLGFLMETRLTYVDSRRDHCVELGVAVRKWFKSCGFDASVLDGADDLTRMHEKAALIPELIVLAARLGRVVLSSNRDKPGRFQVFVDSKHIFISEALLRQAAKKAVLDHGEITSLLAKSDGYVGEASLNGDRGWLVKRRWWRSVLRRAGVDGLSSTWLKVVSAGR